MSDEKPTAPAEKNATSARKAALSELIAKTPGAQPRERLLERIKARQRKCSKKPKPAPPPEEQFATPEPMPMVDADKYAAGYFERLKEKEKAQQNEKPKAQPKQPRAQKPCLVRKDGKPVPPDKQ